MLAHNSVADIAYLIGKQEDRERAEEAAGLRGASAEERVQAVRDGIRVHRGNSYYDKDSSEEEGRFWRPKLKDAVLAKLMTVEPGQEARVGAGRRIADGVEAGQGVETKIARLISMGYDPFTKERLVPSACRYHEKKAQYPEKMTEDDEKRRPRAGYDSTYSIDKPASTLWADAITRGDHKQAKAIEAAILAAVNDAEQFAYDHGLIRTRRVDIDENTKARSEYYESVAEFTSVNFLHKTNRNGDAQLHVHNLKLNACVRLDGTTGTLDTDEYYYQKPVIDAVFKASFYDRLRQIEGLEDIDIVRGDKDVRIRGIPQELVETLSSRRLEVVEELEKRGLTTADRRAAEMAAKATRNEKSDLPPLSDLVGRWRDTILQHTDGEGLLAKLEKRERTEEDRDARILRVAMEAVERFGRTETIVTERDVITETYRAAQGQFGLKDIPEIVHLVKSRFLIQGQYDQDGRQLWGITDLVEKERSFLSMVLNPPKRARLASDAEIERIIDKYKENKETGERGLNEEQKAAIRYLLASDAAMGILEGPPGTGKSFVAGRVKEVLEAEGYRIFGIAPSWKATDVLREDMKLEDDSAKAVAKFIADHKAGKIEINSKTIVVVDEAGMVPVDDMEYVTRVVFESGGYKRDLGDTKQLNPVGAGSPMAKAVEFLGSTRLRVVMRQHNPATPETQRLTDEYKKASAALSDGEVEKGLAIYRDENRIEWLQDLDATYHKAADRFMETYDPKDPKESIIGTSRNVDVHAINAEVRKSMKEAGLLVGEPVVFEAIQRNIREKDRGVKLEVMAGDRVVFGERIEKKLSGLPIPINNNDFATVKEVHRDPKTGEPILHLVFDKAKNQVIRATPRQLTGHREEGELLIPKMNHAFCLSIHGLQGATVNYSTVVDCNGFDYRSLLVGGTRHRFDQHILVNVGRFEDSKMAKLGLVWIDENGHMSIPDSDDERQNVPPEEFKYGPKEYFQYLVKEGQLVTEKRNFTDLPMYSGLENTKKFLADKDWIINHLKRMQENVGQQIDIQENRIIDNKARKEGKIGASLASDESKLSPMEGSENPYRDLRAPSIEPDIEAMRSTGGQEMDQELRARVQQRMHGLRKITPPVKTVQEAQKVAADIPAVQKEIEKNRAGEKVELRKSGLISEAEREEFKRRDPIQFMLANGAQLAKPWDKQNPRSVEMCDGFKGNEPYNRYTVSERNGVWVWNQWNDDTMKGTIDAWMVKKGVSPTYPKAWHKLRDAFATEHLQDAHVVAKPVIEKPKSTYEAHQETLARQLADTGFAGGGKAEERLQAAIDRGRDQDAKLSNLDRVKAATAVKMLEDIQKGEAPTANKFEQKRAADVRKLVEDGKSVHEYRFKYGMQTPWASDTYPAERGIDRATVMRFEHDVKRDVIKDQKTGEWKAGLAFAHRDVIKFGTITGIESKRPVALASNGEPMATTKFTDGEGKGVGMIGNKMRGDKGPTTIVAAESGIDALSWWQQNKLPADFNTKTDEQKLEIAKAVPDDTLMLSVAGTASQHALHSIELVAKNNPQAKWVLAPDNDAAGLAIRDNIQAAVLKGNPKAEIEIQPPENILHKDWNDQVRDVIRSPEGLQKEADRMKVSVVTVDRHLEQYQASHPDRDLSAYRGIGSQEAEAVEQKTAIDQLMKASPKEIEELAARHKVEILGPSRRDTANDAQAEKAAVEAAKRCQEEEDRQKQRGAVQRM